MHHVKCVALYGESRVISAPSSPYPRQRLVSVCRQARQPADIGERLESKARMMGAAWGSRGQALNARTREVLKSRLNVRVTSTWRLAVMSRHDGQSADGCLGSDRERTRL